MESKSTNKNKKRVLTSHRRMSSVLSQSPTKLNASKGNMKYRFKVLIKNNRTLAVALEDARCELLHKQKLFEKASEYFKNIMLARAKMTEMWTALSSVLKDFDGTIEMLKCDNFKLSDIAPPYKSSGKFKNKMKKIDEAIRSVCEESLYESEQENEESDCENSADSPISRKCESSGFCSVPIEATKDIADKTSSPTILHLQAATENCIPDGASSDPFMPGSPCATSDVLVDPSKKKEMTSTTSDSLIASSDTGTPKLSLPMIVLQRNPGIAFSLLEEKNSSKELSKTPENNSSVPVSLLKDNDSSVKKFSKIPRSLNKPKSSLKVFNSKIPKFHAASHTAIKQTVLLDEVSKDKYVGQRISKKKNVSNLQNMNEIDSRRKTFVVKSSDSETAVNLNEEEVIDMNSLDDEQNSQAFASRKTFVVRNSSALEKKRKSMNNKRKTFVKKCNKNNSPKSNKNKRGTFVLNDLNENCNEEECNNLVKEESNKPCASAVEEALPPDSNDSSEIIKNLHLSKKYCFTTVNPKIKNQKNNNEEFFPEVNSEETLENKLESVVDKTKTLVKKCAKNNSHKSLKNKRGTFVLTDIKEHCTEEDQPLTNLVNSECDDLVKEKLDKPYARTVDEAVPSPKSVDDKRKTLVNKCAKDISHKSNKTKRGTFVLTDTKEYCTEEDQPLTNLVNSECKDLVKEKLDKPYAGTVDEAVLSPKSVDDKRKTLVNKCAKDISHKSIKNKRVTFGLTDTKEHCTEQDQPLTNLVNSECDDLVKEKLDKPCAVTLDKAVPSASGDSTKKQESNSEELLPEVGSEGALKKNLVDFLEVKCVKFICNKEDNRVVRFDEKIGETGDLKSIILPQNPSVELPDQADSATNEVGRSTTNPKASKEKINNRTTDSTECNNDNLLLKNSNRRKTCSTLSHNKHTASKIGTPEKEPAIAQTSSQEPQVGCLDSAKEESEKKSVFKEYVPETKVNKNKEGENSLKSKEINEKCKSVIKHAIDMTEKDETNKKKLGLVDLSSDDEIIILNEKDENKRKSRPRNRISYKRFLEPSLSDSETISEVDNFENKIKLLSLSKPPIRGKVSFSKKKNYVFDRKADAKLKPQKHLLKSKKRKSLSSELTSESDLNRNCEDNNSNTDVNQISEDARKNPLLANLKEKELEIGSKCCVTFWDKQEMKLNSVKISENLVNNRTNTDNIKMHKNSIPEILDGKNVNKTILPSNSPVISLDKCLNNIECDIGDKKEKSGKIDFSDEITPKIQNIEAQEDTNNIKKQTYKTSKKKDLQKNHPKRKKKQVIESDMEKENVEDSKTNNKEKMKPNSQNNKEKNCRKKKLAKNNAIVVEAEIHPLPRTLNQLDTNMGNTMNREVAIVLNDIFQSKNIDFLSVNNKEKRDGNCIISSPLSNNSNNILMQVASKPNAAKEEENEDLADCRRPRRARAVNYAEPTLNKKMRRC